ncbi:GNAT family N-acetyltransferase [Sporosarcina pasteurii]|nr:GNAT family N-acetyltransferase [Sporosarcina pasteurii]MDS9470975.1 GNAT family N-acetyltransferase [Sporosarcina pasteurii]QBQ07078.1 N-acetyltransferase [Sporosarcina pasteurii]
MIETERLIIRPYEVTDYKEWTRGYSERLPSTYKYDEGNDGDAHLFTKKWFAEWVEDFQKAAEQDETYLFGIFRKEDGAYIGEIELVTILRLDYEWGMMGYNIHNQFHRQGYGKESVEAATNMFFEDLRFHRIELQIHVDNEPSKKLAESAGFDFECIRKKHYYEGGKWTDQLIYVKYRQSLMG